MANQELSIDITKHAMERLRERLGVPEIACERMALSAYVRGARPPAFKGSMRRYLGQRLNKLKHYNAANDLAVYAGFLYFFKDRKLITVYSIPKGLRE